MVNKPPSRPQKLVNALYPFFGRIALNVNNTLALRTCRHLLALPGQAINDSNILPFVELWKTDHPEENPLTNAELIWALNLLDEHISAQIKNNELARIASKDLNARLRVINGGLSNNPDIPYVDMSNSPQQYNF